MFGYNSWGKQDLVYMLQWLINMFKLSSKQSYTTYSKKVVILAKYLIEMTSSYKE
jgi:hypothetical protein